VNIRHSRNVTMNKQQLGSVLQLRHRVMSDIVGIDLFRGSGLGNNFSD